MNIRKYKGEPSPHKILQVLELNWPKERSIRTVKATFKEEFMGAVLTTEKVFTASQWSRIRSKGYYFE